MLWYAYILSLSLSLALSLSLSLTFSLSLTLSLTHTHTPFPMQVMAMAPSHDIWQRIRPSHHGGAQRSYSQPPTPRYGRSSPPYCEYCTIAKSSASIGTLASKQSEPEMPKLGLSTSSTTGLLHVPQPFGMDLLDDIDHAQSKGKYTWQHYITM